MTDNRELIANLVRALTWYHCEGQDMKLHKKVMPNCHDCLIIFRAKELLAASREEPIEIKIGDYVFSQTNDRVWFSHKSGEGMELTPEIVDKMYKCAF